MKIWKWHAPLLSPIKSVLPLHDLCGNPTENLKPKRFQLKKWRPEKKKKSLHKASGTLSYNSIILHEELLSAYTHPKAVPVPGQGTSFDGRGWALTLNREFLQEMLRHPHLQLLTYTCSREAMTPHFCLPARHGGLQHTTPAGTSRPRRGRRAAEAEKTRISPGRPLSPRRGRRQRAGRCPRSPPRRLRGPPRGEPGVSPSSRPCRGRGGSTSRGGHGRRRPPTPHASPRAGRRRREKRAAAAAGSFPPAPPSRPFTSAAASCACSGRRAAGDRGRPGPAPPRSRLPAHLGARTRSGPPRRPPPA